MSDAPARELSREQRAASLVEKHYEALKATVLKAVGDLLWRKGVRLDPADLEDAYSEAWHATWERAKREEIENLRGFLITVAHRRALDIFDARANGPQPDLAIDAHADAGDLVERVDDKLTLRALLTRIAQRLNPGELQAVSLYYLHGYPRKEIATLLALREATIQKRLDRANKKLEGIARILQSRGCQEGEWSRAIRAYALGSMSKDSRDYQRVAEHLQQCKACARYVAALRGLAAALPPLSAPLTWLTRAGRRFARVSRILRRSARTGSPGTPSSAAVASSNAGGASSLLGASAATKAAAVIAVGAVIASATVPVVAGHSSTRTPPAAPTPPVARPAPLLLRAAPLPASAADARTSTPSRSGKRQRQPIRAHAKAPRPHRGVARPHRAAAQQTSVVPAQRIEEASQNTEEEFAFERSTAASESSPSPEAKESTPSAPANQADQLEASETEFGFERPQ